MIAVTRNNTAKNRVSTSALAIALSLGTLSIAITAFGQDVVTQADSTSFEIIRVRGSYSQKKHFEPVEYKVDIESSLRRVDRYAGTVYPNLPNYRGGALSPIVGKVEITGSNGIFVGSKIDVRSVMLNGKNSAGALDANVTHLRSADQSQVIFGGLKIQSAKREMMSIVSSTDGKAIVEGKKYELQSRAFAWNFDFGDLKVSGPQMCTNLHSTTFGFSSFKNIQCDYDLTVISNNPDSEQTGQQVTALMAFLQVVMPQSGTFALTFGAP